MELIIQFQCSLRCRLQFVSIWTSLKLCRLVMGYKYLKVLQQRFLEQRKFFEWFSVYIGAQINGRIRLGILVEDGAWAESDGVAPLRDCFRVVVVKSSSI